MTEYFFQDGWWRKSSPNTQDIKPRSSWPPSDNMPKYKLITSVVNSESVHKYLQLDLLTDNLLIDKAILEDATKNNKNLSCP